MLKRFLTVVAFAALPVAYGVSLAAVPLFSASPQAKADPVPTGAVQPAPNWPAHQQMRDFDRRARTDMILYRGSFGGDSHLAGPPLLGPTVSATTLPPLTR